MRGTGNNRQKNEKILSIRLASDGLSFSVISPSGDYTAENRIPFSRSGGSAVDIIGRTMEAYGEFSDEYSSVQIFLDTADTVYVPAEVMSTDKDSGELWLNLAGVYPSMSQKIVVSPDVSGLCAVMAFESEETDLLKAKFGDKAAFFSPLQENIEIKGRLGMNREGYVVNLTENNFYITSFDGAGRLSIAEVYPCNSDADMIYYLHKLSGGKGGGMKADFRHLRIYLYGSRAAASFKTLRKYFRGAVCV